MIYYDKNKGKAIKAQVGIKTREIVSKQDEQSVLDYIANTRKESNIQAMTDSANSQSIRPSEPKQGFFSKIIEIALNPLTAAGYAARNKDLPDNFSRGPRNTLDYALDVVNPAQYAYDTKNVIQGTATLDGMQILEGAAGVIPIPLAKKAITSASKAFIKKSRVPLRKTVDTFHPVGKELRQIQSEGLKAGYSLEDIKDMQMSKIGITSAQRKGYFPGVSEVMTDYMTPYGYENATKRLLNIPKRIIKGDKNSKKLVDMYPTLADDLHRGADVISKPRQDAWNLYSGIPQKNNTFRVAGSAPKNHPLYNKGELNNREIFSINREKQLLKELPDKRLPGMDMIMKDQNRTMPHYLKDIKQLEDIKKKGIDSSVDFNTTNIMGNYNRRFYKGKMEYNDIWDLNLNGRKVENFYGRPFLSHGKLDYDIDENLNIFKDASKRALEANAARIYKPQFNTEQLDSNFTMFAAPKYTKSLVNKKGFFDSDNIKNSIKGGLIYKK
jgi:hypothetical protein